MKADTIKKVKCLLLCLLTGVLLVACGGGGGSDSSGQVGTVGVSLTDNAGPYNAVVLSIEKIGVVASNSNTTYYNSSDFSELPVTVDILDLPGEATLFLGDIDVPLPGDGSEVCFNQIRLVLSEDGNYVIESGDPEMTKHDLKTPSGQTSGVKVLVKEETFCISNEVILFQSRAGNYECFIKESSFTGSMFCNHWRLNQKGILISQHLRFCFSGPYGITCR